MKRAYISPDEGRSLDLLSQPASVAVAARNLRAGMVVLDHELGTPWAVLMTRQRAARNSGNVEYLAYDLDAGWLFGFVRHEHTSVAVMAR